MEASRNPGLLLPCDISAFSYGQMQCMTGSQHKCVAAKAAVFTTIGLLESARHSSARSMFALFSMESGNQTRPKLEHCLQKEANCQCAQLIVGFQYIYISKEIVIIQTQSQLS